MELPEPYELDQLEDTLIDIYLGESGHLNIPRALYTLLLEIKKLKECTKQDL